MPFLTELVLKPTRKSGEWELVEDLDYETGDGDFIRVPKGFKTDLASIPRPLRFWFSVNGKHREAAVLHDFGYKMEGKIIALKAKLTRLQVDNLFLDAMRELCVRLTKRWAMYLGVRMGGFIYWEFID